MTYVSAAMRRKVIERAGNCCEYCRKSQNDHFFSYEVDHIISEKHNGKTELENLAWSCPDCNSFKGSDLGSIDQITSILTPLFNPRIQTWEQHFRLDGESIEPLSAEGRVTVFVLQLNHIDRLIERIELIKLGRYPCKP
jgi:hypothetical protein